MNVQPDFARQLNACLQNILKGSIVNGTLGIVEDFMTVSEAEQAGYKLAFNGYQPRGEFWDDIAPPPAWAFPRYTHEGLSIEPARVTVKNQIETDLLVARYPVVRVTKKGIDSYFLFLPHVFPVTGDEGDVIAVRKQVSSPAWPSCRALPDARFPSCRSFVRRHLLRAGCSPG